MATQGCRRASTTVMRVLGLMSKSRPMRSWGKLGGVCVWKGGEECAGCVGVHARVQVDPVL